MGKKEEEMSKLRVLILFGGCSDEHDVSVKSAMNVAKNIDTEKYEPFYVGTTRDGAWKLCERPCLGWEEQRLRAVALSPDKHTRGLLIADRRQCIIQNIDVAFPVMHGRYGEDGAIQGLFELAGIPYVGCGIASSAICLDKALTYAVASEAGVAVPEHVICGVESPAAPMDLPVFVKPARSGSSFGVSKVEQDGDFQKAVEAAAAFDEKVLVEREVRGSEVGCAVLGTGSDLVVGELDQIVLSHGFFRIHQESDPESGSENSEIRVPAEIAPEDHDRVIEVATSTFRALGCQGLARVDMFLCDGGRVVLNEVNTMPGLTSYSRYPRMMEAAGVSLANLIDCLINLALKRGA